jgi:hypothetical protein
MEKQTQPDTIITDMEVVAEAASPEALALIPNEPNEERQVNEPITKKKDKVQYIDGPAQRLVNIRIALKSAINKQQEWSMKVKELKAKEKRLVKIIDEYNAI